MEQLGLGPARTSGEWDYVAQNPVMAMMAKEKNMEVGTSSYKINQRQSRFFGFADVSRFMTYVEQAETI